MEVTLEQKKIKQQKIWIIILSVFLVFFMASALTQFIITMQNRNSLAIEITLKDIRKYPNRLTEEYIVEITCDKDQIINVKDFTSKTEEGYRVVTYIEYEDKEYETDGNFIIHKDTKNILKLYILNGENTIYFKHKPIKVLETKKVYNEN